MGQWQMRHFAHKKKCMAAECWTRQRESKQKKNWKKNKKNWTEYWITNKGVSKVAVYALDKVYYQNEMWKQCQWKIEYCHCPFSSELNWFWESIIHEFNTHNRMHKEKTWKMDTTHTHTKARARPSARSSQTFNGHFYSRTALFNFSFLFDVFFFRMNYAEFPLWHDFLSLAISLFPNDNNLLWFRIIKEKRDGFEQKNKIECSKSFG